MNHKDLTLEEKVDLLLEHQEKTIFWARIKAIAYVLFFIVFIVLPIMWSFYFIKNLFSGVNVSALMGTVENLQAPLNIDIIKNFIN